MEEKKSKKVVLIAVISVVLVVAIGLTVFFVLRSKGKNKTPEEIAQEYLDASEKKDWKRFVDQTTDEELEVIFEVDHEAIESKGLTSVAELRTWASENVYKMPDPMQGKAIGKYSVGEVLYMTPAEYIEDYLYGDTGDPYYLFIKNQDEIAVVTVNYTMVEGDKEIERTDHVVEYKKDGKWSTIEGMMVVHILLTITH